MNAASPGTLLLFDEDGALSLKPFLVLVIAVDDFDAPRPWIVSNHSGDLACISVNAVWLSKHSKPLVEP